MAVNPKMNRLNMAVQITATLERLVAIVPETECLFLSCWLLFHEGADGVEMGGLPVCDYGGRGMGGVAVGPGACHEGWRRREDRRKSLWHKMSLASNDSRREVAIAH